MKTTKTTLSSCLCVSISFSALMLYFSSAFYDIYPANYGQEWSSGVRPITDILQRDMSKNISRVPWPNDTSCEKYDVHFGIDIPKIWLISYPRSGNTWIRYLVEMSSGFFTGSVYNDKSLHKMGYIGEFEPDSSDRVLLVKSHFNCKNESHSDVPVILIVRDPRKSIMSLFTWIKHATKLNSHLIQSAPNEFKTKAFHNHAMKGISNWEQLMTSCLETARNIYPIYYEDMKANPIEGIKEMFRKILNVSVDSERLKCVAKYVQGPVYRKQKYINPYNEHEMDVILGSIRRVSELLQKRGFKPLVVNPQMEA